MRRIILNINPSIYEHIVFFLKNLPQKLVDIEYDNKNQNDDIAKKSSKNNVFGMLKGKTGNPAEWQRNIREESDRDIHI